MQNEQILLKSKVDFIEKNCLPKPQATAVSTPSMYSQQQPSYAKYNYQAYNENKENYKVPQQPSINSEQLEDTEDFIKKVSSRFEEAKKLMNESNLFNPKL